MAGQQAHIWTQRPVGLSCCQPPRHPAERHGAKNDEADQLSTWMVKPSAAGGCSTCLWKELKGQHAAASQMSPELWCCCGMLPSKR